MVIILNRIKILGTGRDPVFMYDYPPFSTAPPEHLSTGGTAHKKKKKKGWMETEDSMLVNMRENLMPGLRVPWFVCRLWYRATA